MSTRVREVEVGAVHHVPAAGRHPFSGKDGRTPAALGPHLCGASERSQRNAAVAARHFGDSTL